MSSLQDTIVMIWGTSLLLVLVVALVVAWLLLQIRGTAGQILEGASAIWTQGKLVANNTIQIPLLLGRVVRQVSGITEEVRGIGGATQQIESHAEACPGCPACVLGAGEEG